MGDHRTNPKAVAARLPRGRTVPALDLGDGYGFLGFQLEPIIQDGVFGAVVVAQCQRLSDLTANPVFKVTLGIVGEIAIADIKGTIAKAMDGEPAEAPKDEEAAA